VVAFKKMVSSVHYLVFLEGHVGHSPVREGCGIGVDQV